MMPSDKPLSNFDSGYAQPEGLPQVVPHTHDGVNTPMVNCPYKSSGIVAPTSTPQWIGDIYINTVAKKIYFATGTSSSADWTIVN